MASNETIALISGGSAVLGGLIGAAAGHFTTIRSQKLLAEEEHFRHRQGVYQDFLNAAHDFLHSAPDIGHKDQDDWSEWFREFELKLTAVQLFGTKKARTGALWFKAAVENVLEDGADQEKGETAIQRRRAAYIAHEKEVMKAYDVAISAMRSDVGQA